MPKTIAPSPFHGLSSADIYASAIDASPALAAALADAAKHWADTERARADAGHAFDEACANANVDGSRIRGGRWAEAGLLPSVAEPLMRLWQDREATERPARHAAAAFDEAFRLAFEDPSVRQEVGRAFAERGARLRDLLTQVQAERKSIEDLERSVAKAPDIRALSKTIGVGLRRFGNAAPDAEVSARASALASAIVGQS